MPKAEDDSVRKSIIRTAIKNENLLAKKMELLRVKKNTATRKTSSLKHKLQRSSKLDGVLGNKIEQSIARAKYVQSARKAGWDQINRSIGPASLKAGADKTPETDDKDASETHEGPPSSVTAHDFRNKFALLEEAEA